MLTDEWCRFFKENNWLVGVSIDGPQEFHDEDRKNKQGKPSFVKVIQGINLLKKHGVEWNGMAVVLSLIHILTTTLDALNAKLDLLNEKCIVNHSCYFGATNDNYSCLLYTSP